MQVILDEPIVIEENELPPQIENEEEMKLRDDDKIWLTGEITRIVNEQVAGPIAELKAAIRPQGAKKMFFWLREWGILGVNITVILTLFGLLLTAVYYAVHRISDEATFQQSTKDHFDKIDERLGGIERRLVDLQLSSLSTKPVTAQIATQISGVLSDAVAKGQKVDPQVIADLGQSLAAGADKAASIPTVWQAASKVVNYRFAANETNATVRQLPNCLSFYGGHTEDGIPPPTRPAPSNYPAVDEQRFGNCELALDDVSRFIDSGFGKAYARNLKMFPATKLVLNVSDAVITYSGGKLIPFHTLMCRNCIFRTNVRQLPVPEGQKVMRNLLIADTSNVQLSASGE